MQLLNKDSSKSIQNNLFFIEEKSTSQILLFSYFNSQSDEQQAKRILEKNVEQYKYSYKTKTNKFYHTFCLWNIFLSIGGGVKQTRKLAKIWTRKGSY